MSEKHVLRLIATGEVDVEIAEAVNGFLKGADINAAVIALGLDTLEQGTLASPPTVDIGEVWLDTTGGGTVHPILRVRLS